MSLKVLRELKNIDEDKFEFMRQYVLNRASAMSSLGLDGKTAAESASVAWETILKESKK